jgi:hypothetical protein
VPYSSGCNEAITYAKGKSVNSAEMEKEGCIRWTGSEYIIDPLREKQSQTTQTTANGVTRALRHYRNSVSSTKEIQNSIIITDIAAGKACKYLGRTLGRLRCAG